jgi:hypothetical protein
MLPSIRVQYVVAWISTGLRFVYMYLTTWILNFDLRKIDLGRVFRKVTIAYFVKNEELNAIF